MGDLSFKTNEVSKVYSKLDKEYNKFINKMLLDFDETKIDRLDVYNLIMSELTSSNSETIINEIKYRVTDGEDLNVIMLDVICSKNYSSEILWLLKNRIESYIDEDFFNRFY